MLLALITQAYQANATAFQNALKLIDCFNAQSDAMHNELQEKESILRESVQKAARPISDNALVSERDVLAAKTSEFEQQLKAASEEKQQLKGLVESLRENLEAEVAAKGDVEATLQYTEDELQKARATITLIHDKIFSN